MGIFRVRVVYWERGECVVLATHQQEAETIECAIAAVAEKHCGGRSLYDSKHLSQPYVSHEGWEEVIGRLTSCPFHFLRNTNPASTAGFVR